MSFAAASDDFEKPYLNRSNLPCPPVELRVALVAAQAISYCQVYPPPPPLSVRYPVAQPLTG